MIIITNFKTYANAMGEHAVSLAKIHEQVAKETGVQFAVAPSIVDLERVHRACPNLPIFAQHVDLAEHGAFTGRIPPEFVKRLGATGTLLNHSEYRIEKEMLFLKAKRAKEAGLVVLMCVENVEEAVEFMNACNPDFISLEPKELIGGDISVCTANPEIIIEAVAKIGGNRIIVGAGVKNAQDVRMAKQLGASGVLLASGITKSKDPYTVLKDLASGALQDAVKIHLPF
jgi:triosephosphate isomerase